MLLPSGCEHNGGDSGGNSVVGTWGPADSDARTVFKADGTWDDYKDAALTDRHYGGTYTQSGKSVIGKGTNPGVGDLEIDCTLSDDGNTMQMDFIEFWHDPPKHTPGTLTRM